MKNIAICYSEHAVKVSNSYCSGASHHTNNTTSSPLSAPSIQTAVASIYKVKLSNEKQFLIRIRWCTPSPAFSITISDPPFSAEKLSRSFKIPRRQSGSEILQAGSLKADVLWDLRRARFGPGPEPVTGYYIAVLVNSELALTLGDMEHEFEEATKLSAQKKFSLISRGGEAHGRGFRGGLLGVDVDGKGVIEVKRVQWNFRGNQSLFLDGLMVDLMWDVHDWVFKPS
ncbi:uncharacterized protein LOC121800802 [Salvia splendens]|uniref:uncharacterized protein LOC121800802 n=1 Tax=Salvia splendens TaxID=180675 RepID=UPI001C2522A5|nr:uncharacterized protein LOC121800802 [Salvia splendens]